MSLWEIKGLWTLESKYFDFGINIFTIFNQGIERYNKSKGVSLAWDQVQVNLKKLNFKNLKKRQLYCCGVNNATDWKGIPPDSCCLHYHIGKRL